MSSHCRADTSHKELNTPSQTRGRLLREGERAPKMSYTFIDLQSREFPIE